MSQAADVASLVPVSRQSLSDAVFEQLRDQIVRGQRPPGSRLPSERLLCEALGVNRGAVREALRRLEQARLVSVRHGGSSHVLDFRACASLDLLGSLVLGADGRIDGSVVRSILEMRSAIAPDAARLAAARRSDAAAASLRQAAEAMRDAGDDLALLQERAVGFWSIVIDAAGNVAYRLAYNSMRETYDKARGLMAPVLAAELTDFDSYNAIAAAIGRGDAATAEQRSRALMHRGEAAVNAALSQIEAFESTARS